MTYGIGKQVGHCMVGRTEYTEWEKEGREGKGRSERSWRRGETVREREGRGVGEERGKEREREGKRREREGKRRGGVGGERGKEREREGKKGRGRGREGGGAFLASVTRLTQENASSNEKCN